MKHTKKKRNKKAAVWSRGWLFLPSTFVNLKLRMCVTAIHKLPHPKTILYEIRMKNYRETLIWGDIDGDFVSESVRGSAPFGVLRVARLHNEKRELRRDENTLAKNFFLLRSEVLDEKQSRKPF